MKQISIFIALIAFAPQAQAGGCEFDLMKMAVSGKNCPKDVATLVERTYACGHFESEPYDEDEVLRKAFLGRSIRELQCDNLKTQLNAIKRKYRKNLTILRFIKTHANLS
jgi:hypothetical protein